MIAYLLKASAVAILFYVCYNLFLKKETFFQHNRWFLLIGLVTASIFPLIVIPIYIPIETFEMSTTAIYINETIGNTVTNSPQAFEWQSLLPNIYGIGCCIFLIQFLLQISSLILLLLKNPKNKDGIYTYIIVKRKISPFSFFKWIVFNPKQFSYAELQLILNHEKIHVRQFHSIDVLITRLACIIFWFNPLIWFYKKEVAQNLEYIADEKAQHETKSEKEYQRLLLKTSVTNHNISLTNNFYNSLIKKRIIMLHKSKSNPKNLWKSALILPLLSMLLMSVNTKEIYTEAKKTATEQKLDIKNNPIEIIFTKDLPNTELDIIKAELKDYGIIMRIEAIDRNKKGEISKININFTTKTGSANYSAKEEDGIKPFYFRQDDENGFGVGPVLNTFHPAAKNDKNTKGGVYTFSNKPNDTLLVKGQENTFIFRSNKVVDSIRFNSKATINNGGRYTFISADSIRFKHKDTIFLAPKNKIKKAQKGKVISLDSINSNNLIKKSISIYGDNNTNNLSVFNKGNEPLYIVDGIEIEKSKFKNLSPDDIENINVVKGKAAIKNYGSDGENGVIIINTKNGDNKVSKWQVRTGVNFVKFIDDKDPSKNAQIAYISKHSSGAVLKQHKLDLKKIGLSVKYGKLKRNAEGEITRLKISIRDKEGNSSTATYEDKDGIPGIRYGISESAVIITSDKI